VIENNIRIDRENQMEIRVIEAAQTRAIRALVLRPDQTPEMTAFVGDQASDTLHLGAFEHNQLVGIVTIIHRSPEDIYDRHYNKLWLLRGMATLPQVRGQGYGAALVRSGCAYVAREQGTYLWCDARESAIGFYMKLGFAIRGNRFKIPFTGPHYRMWREITATDTAYSPGTWRA
jgi:GNAT superfamily N-acetyltransferase